MDTAGSTNAFGAYVGRNRLLRAMGFASYPDYLASEKWAKIRLRVLQKDRFTCRLCQKRATQVHHLRYDRRTLSGQSLKWLRSVCPDCHRDGEFDGRRKRSLQECNDAMGVALTKGQLKYRKQNGLPMTWAK